MNTRIVIAGGGFAGLYVAMHLDRTLARDTEVEVLLISRENFILFTPTLHEVAAGDLYPGDIVNPLRRILRHLKVVEADVEAIDLSGRKLRCVTGTQNVRREFEFDHLLLTLGSETDFFDMADVHDWAVTMKNLSDAALLRDRMVALLEEATLETEESARRKALTFVTAGDGFAGVETTGAVNDFVRETADYYPSISEAWIRVVVVHPGSSLLPELGGELGRYAERKLRERKVEVIKHARVASYDGSIVRLTDGTSIPAATLIWTAGIKPSAVISRLACEKERGRVRVNEYLAVPGSQRTVGGWRLRSSTGFRDGEVLCVHRTTRLAGRRGGRQKYRTRDSRSSAEALPFYNDGILGQHRSPHWRCHGLWD